MSAVLIAIQVIVCLLSPICHLILGKKTIAALLGVLGFTEDSWEVPASVTLVFGLLLALTCSFFLKCLQLPWPVAALLPLIVPLTHPRTGLDFEALRYVRNLPWQLSINSLLWFTACLYFGLSLFDASSGISTIWRNNFGDLTFHLGMITSFVFGDNIPPEYHLYPGLRLSYPFLINFWSASLWWIYPSFRALATIFMFQWIVIWMTIYYLLRGDRNRLLPWALLLGGGSLIAIDWQALGTLESSNPLIAEGFFWTTFFTTIWVPQRAAMLGACCLLTALRTFSLYRNSQQQAYLVLTGIILGLSVLAHTHLFLIGATTIGTVLLIDVLRPNETSRKQALHAIVKVIIAGLPALLFLPWIIGKSGIVQLNFCPIVDGDPSLVECTKSWLKNTPVLIALVPFLWAITRRHRFFVAMTFVFLAANAVLLSKWHWDQLKIFLGLYVVLLFIWSEAETRSSRWLQLLCMPLLLPACFELYGIYKKLKPFQVYSETDVRRAEEIRHVVPADAAILAAPNHNSLVTLTGRSIYLGYDGTLWSHGIEYAKRRARTEKLLEINRCSVESNAEFPEACPEYLLWQHQERNKWRLRLPQDTFVKTELEYLYRIEQAEKVNMQ